jgi:hypothetical protein
MKLSCLSLSYRDSFREGTMTLESFVETCYAMQMESVDLHASHFVSDERGYLLDVKRACLRRGLDVACVAISNDFGKKDDALREEVGKVKRWTTAAALLGAPLARVFAGWARGDDEPAAWARTVESLRACAEHGAQVGVSVALQNHNHLGLTRTGDDVLRMMQEVNHPNLTHLLDTGNTSAQKARRARRTRTRPKSRSTPASPRPRRWRFTSARKSTASPPAKRSGWIIRAFSKSSKASATTARCAWSMKAGRTNTKRPRFRRRWSICGGLCRNSSSSSSSVV